MPASKPSVSPQSIPPRALRSDVPGGTMWVPRWKWAGRLFGREVRLPPTVCVTKATPNAETVSPDMVGMALPKVEPTAVSPSVDVNPKKRPESFGEWAKPLLAILGVLAVFWGLGVSFGYVLAKEGTPSWMSGGSVGGVVGAFLMAPSGALLLLLAALGCFVQAADEEGTRRVWQLAGWGLIALFLLVLYSGFLR